MPHIVIKMISGPSKEAQQKAAEEIREIVEKTLGKPKRYTSVSVEEYSFDEWESVYNAEIQGSGKLVIQPGYTDPKTFR